MTAEKLADRSIAVVGATGSVGTQALDVARHFGIRVSGISCAGNVKKAEEIIREFKPGVCGVTDSAAAEELRARIRDTDCKVVDGENAAEAVAESACADTVLNSVTGIAGLAPSVAALKCGKKLALANKESLVTAGEIVMGLAEKMGLPILPVDSEHCALSQSLECGKREQVKKLILTASGGPFRGMSADQLAAMTADDALRHPTWNMGKKITVDSATMMNKGFEIIEAAWLFGIQPDSIDVIVHPESIIHSMVEYNDRAVIAQLAVPDMRLCVQYALTAPERFEGVTSALDLAAVGKMTFFKPDEKTFPLLALARVAYAKGGTVCAALNGANEVAVALFLENRITLPKLFEAVEEATLKPNYPKCDSLEAVYEADRIARNAVRERFNIPC
ncbi:MAG: 1-deoxy-D-xylulose-5-phosphate reductoisomerase [Clostridia bacterium]|nr:1-deoxy-D-xylulose-5-phosphate reductoisomerase [Clostridia bacterium]